MIERILSEDTNAENEEEIAMILDLRRKLYDMYPERPSEYEERNARTNQSRAKMKKLFNQMYDSEYEDDSML